MGVPKVKLNSGHSIPAVGLGLWKIKHERKCRETVEAALEAGYRHFDTAQIYGNEEYLGAALNESDIPRDQLFITTKLWNSEHWPDDALASFDKSLENLRTDYVDLFLIHFPVTETRRMAWEVLEEIARSGRAKSIGVSNYTTNHLETLLSECSIKPAVNQVEMHVFLQQPNLLEFCKIQGIAVEAYSPLAHGKGIDNVVLASIAHKHDKTPAQIILRWCIEIGTIPLPKSTHPDRLEQNIDIFDFKLDDEDMAAIQKLESNLRTCWDPTRVP